MLQRLFVCFTIALLGFSLTGCGGGGGGGGSTTPSPSNSLEIVIPTAGQTLAGNNSEEITWTSEGTVGNLLIELSVDGGTTFSTLVEDTPNDGSELVSLPDTRNESCTIRITETDGSATDESGIFTIWSNVAPSVQNVTMSATNGDIDISYDLTDADGDSCSILVEYFNGGEWLSATVTGIVTDIAPSTGLTLVWNSDTDSVGLDISSCQIRITPFDTEYGDAGTSEAFEVHNISFQTIGAGLTGFAGASMAWGDYDNDGDLDLAVTGRYIYGFDDTITSIYINNGDNTFTDIEAGLPGVLNGCLAWGDYDNDGDLDLVIAGRIGPNSYITSLYKNDGGSFVKVKSFTHAYLASIAWGDYDNDGDLDFVVAGYNSVYNDTIIRICINNGNDAFTETQAGLPGVRSCSLSWGDYDNDGDLDLALCGNSIYPNELLISRIYRNEEGSFTDINAELTGVQYGSMVWGDYDNDGDLDLAMAGYTGSSYITRIYKNENQIFSAIGAGLPGATGCSLAWGDYDNDGDLDLAMAGYIGNDDETARIYRNDDGSFSDISAGLPGVRSSELAWGDYDNDGDLDLALSGWPADGSETYITRIYNNNSARPNSLPEQPANLQTYIAGDSGDNNVLFMWEAGQDEETPSPGLSYQLRIGTTEGGNDVWTGHHLADGQRLVPEMGKTRPIGGNISYKLLSLPSGTYYWTVQTIDSAFEGSTVLNTSVVTVP